MLNTVHIPYDYVVCILYIILVVTFATCICIQIKGFVCLVTFYTISHHNQTN